MSIIVTYASRDVDVGLCTACTASTRLLFRGCLGLCQLWVAEVDHFSLGVDGAVRPWDNPKGSCVAAALVRDSLCAHPQVVVLADHPEVVLAARRDYPIEVVNATHEELLIACCNHS